MNSRDKGARGEREFSALCRSEGYEVHRGCQYHGGPDSPDVSGLAGVHVEVKRVERLNIEEAMAQARRDSGAKMPIVAHRRNNSDWLVTMDAADWFRLYREWEAGQG